MIVKKRCFFPPWRESEHEQWLQDMSRQGLHLLDADWFGNHSFIPGPAQDWVYRWSVLPNREREQYKQLYRDAGWEIAAVTVGFICWRKLAAEGRTEVFTEAAAKRRQMFAQVSWLGAAAAFFAVAATGGPDGASLLTQAWRTAAALWLAYSALRLGWLAFSFGRKA